MSERRDMSDLQSEMQRVRGELGRDVDELIESTRDAMNWHYYVRRHPWVCVGAALLVGYLLAPKSSRPIVRIQHPEVPQPQPQPQRKTQSGGVGGMLRAAALSGAARLAGGLATQLATRIVEQSRTASQADLPQPHEGD